MRAVRIRNRLRSARLDTELSADLATADAPRRGDAGGGGVADATLLELGRLFAGHLDEYRTVFADDPPAPSAEPVVITGAALGLPGAAHVFDDANVSRILSGEQGIDAIPTRIRNEILDKHITRLVKADTGARFETIDSPPT